MNTDNRCPGGHYMELPVGQLGLVCVEVVESLDHVPIHAVKVLGECKLWCLTAPLT